MTADGRGDAEAFNLATFNIRCVKSDDTCDDRPGGKFPSDHDAVVVRLKFR